MTKKRIAILTHEFPPLIGGVGTYCVEMATAASHLGHDVTVFAPDHGVSNDGDSFPFAVQRFGMGAYRTAELPKLIRLLMRDDFRRFDIVLMADWPVILAARLALLMRSFLMRPLTFRVMLHGTDALILRQGRLPRLVGAGHVLALAEKIFANSAYTLRVARSNHPNLPAERAEVTLLGVSPYWFEPTGNTTALRARLGIPADRRIILSVSRLDERKGHRHMLATLDRLDAVDKDKIVYVIVGRTGDPAYEKELRRTAATIGLPVVFAGGLANEDVRTLYSDAYLFFLLGEERPDKVEGFGLVFLEAAAQGTPSLASPIGGVPEVVLDGKTGVLADWRAPSDTATALSALLNDEDRRDLLGTAARDWAAGLTWRHCAEMTFS